MNSSSSLLNNLPHPSCTATVTCRRRLAGNLAGVSSTCLEIPGTAATLGCCVNSNSTAVRPPSVTWGAGWHSSRPRPGGSRAAVNGPVRASDMPTTPICTPPRWVCCSATSSFCGRVEVLQLYLRCAAAGHPWQLHYRQHVSAAVDDQQDYKNEDNAGDTAENVRQIIDDATLKLEPPFCSMIDA